MRKITFTVFPTAITSRPGKPIHEPWSEWIRVFSKHSVRGSVEDTNTKAILDRHKDGTCIVLGSIKEGKGRSKLTVLEATAIGIDIEDVEDAKIAAALENLAPFEYFLWTTHKHGSDVAKGLTRIRIVLPFETPITQSEYSSTWIALNRLIGGVNDPSTRDISRLHYLPSTFDLSLAWNFHNEGRWITIGDLPEQSDVFDEIGEAAVRDRYADETQHAAVAKASELKEYMIRVGKNHELKKEFAALVKGEVFALPGERHQVFLNVTWALALKDGSLGERSLELLFGPSIKAMDAANPGDPPSMAEILDAYYGAVAKIIESEEKEKIDEGREKLRKAQQAQLAAGDGDSPYTEEEIVKIAETARCTVEGLSNRWIIQREGAHWFLSSTGAYAGPFTKDDAEIAAAKYLSQAPIRLIETTKTGFRYRALKDIVRDHGQIADKIVSDFIEQKTTFRNGVMYEAARPRRPFEPVYDEAIDQWLRKLAGPHYSKLIDWLSCVPDLEKLLCALYLDGAPASGKTLLATGLSRIWTEGPPADIELALGDFNEEIVRCPLVLADEEIPKRYNRSTVTTQLRSIISTMTRTLTRKFRAPAELRGAIRLVLAANNAFLLDSRDVSSNQDLEAVAQRFFYINVSSESTDYLNELPRATRQKWAEQSIAQHTLWLQANHEVVNPGKRFWVEGDISQMHRMLMTGSRWNSLVTEWLVKYAMDPKPFDSLNNGFIRRGEGEFLVNDQGLIDAWDTYIKEKVDPVTAKISSALRAISSSAAKKQLRYNGQRVRYRTIDVDQLIAWSDDKNIGDSQVIQQNLLGISIEDDRDSDETMTDDLNSIPALNDEGTPF